MIGQGIFLVLVSLVDLLAPPDLRRLAENCAPKVATNTMLAVVATESAGNPFAIGIVGGHLAIFAKHPEKVKKGSFSEQVWKVVFLLILLIRAIEMALCRKARVVGKMKIHPSFFA